MKIAKDKMTLFDFTGHFKSDPDFIQHRYVCACNEAQAIEKIEAYARRLVRNGFDEFIYHGYPIVDCEGVIV